ncbi:MAG: hypothetical protein MUC49_14740 [Raineya sp.]|jgi:hypothetical protein|nr:hypothetical protein [Raineya sp.]
MKTFDYTRTIRTSYYTNFIALVVVIAYIVTKKFGFWRSVGYLILGSMVASAGAYALAPPVEVMEDETGIRPQVKPPKEISE